METITQMRDKYEFYSDVFNYLKKCKQDFLETKYLKKLAQILLLTSLFVKFLIIELKL